MNKLENILNIAYHDSPYYSTTLENKSNVIGNYPILTRCDIQKNIGQLISSRYGGKYFDDLIRRSTSGSTGAPIDVYWDSGDYARSLLPLWRLRNKYYNINPNSRQVNFTFNHYQQKSTIEHVEYYIDKNVMSFNRSSFRGEKDYDEFYKKICDFEPEWLYIQPFVLDNLSDYFQRNKLTVPCSLRYIECVGEILTDEIRTKAESVFKVPIASMYGSEEMNGIALECPYHTMHIIEDNVYAECITNDGNISSLGDGEILLTNLNNKAMPLIRYKQGDSVEIIRQNCECGNKQKSIRIIKGRIQDSFEIDGNTINSYMFSEAIGILNNVMGGPVLRYKFIYSKDEKVLSSYLKIAPRFKNWQGTIKGELMSIFNKINITNVEIQVIFVDEIDTMEGNKYKILEVK